MPAPLRSISARAPGLYGLNTQASAAAISPRWALEATNLVFDDSARLVSRKGSTRIHSSAINGGADTKVVFEYKASVSSTHLIAAGGNKVSASDANDFTTWTDKTAGITTPTADNWKFTNYNGYLVGVQAGHNPIEWDGSGAFSDSVFSNNDPGEPIDVLSAYGRLWWLKSDGRTVVYSGILDSPTAGAGSDEWHGAGSGSFDVTGITFPSNSEGGGWMVGDDFATSLAAFEDKLIIFGRNGIIIYGGVEDPNNNLYAHDAIAGIGCIARDSIQHIGTDILFVDSTGLRSLARTIQNEKMPIQDLSKNVRDDLVIDIESDRGTSFVNIKSGYQKQDGFYVLATPGNVWVFDLKFPIEENESFRATAWDCDFNAFSCGCDGDMYIASPDGYVTKYDGYLDNQPLAGGSGDTYNMSYKSSWQDFASQTGGGGEVIKFPKIYKVTVKGIKDQVVNLALAYDFSAAVYTEAKTITNVPTAAEWGEAEWGIGEWAGNSIFNFEFLRSSPIKSGQYIQMQVSAQISGAAVGIQTIELLVKMGRYAR